MALFRKCSNEVMRFSLFWSLNLFSGPPDDTSGTPSEMRARLGRVIEEQAGQTCGMGL